MIVKNKNWSLMFWCQFKSKYVLPPLLIWCHHEEQGALRGFWAAGPGLSAAFGTFYYVISYLEEIEIRDWVDLGQAIFITICPLDLAKVISHMEFSISILNVNCVEKFDMALNLYWRRGNIFFEGNCLSCYHVCH